MSSKKMLWIFTSCDKMGSSDKETGWYLPEAAHPYYVFKEAGIDMTFASPKGGKAPVDPGSVQAFKEDPICVKLLADDKVMADIANTKKIEDVNPKDFDGVFFPGGHGPMFDLPGCAASNAAAAQVYEAGGVVSAVCHGPAGIVDIQLADGSYLVRGKQVTCFTDAEEAAVQLTELMPFLLETRLCERGALFSSAPLFQPHVQVSERLVTGQNPASAGLTAEAVVRLLQGR